MGNNIRKGKNYVNGRNYEINESITPYYYITPVGRPDNAYNPAKLNHR